MKFNLHCAEGHEFEAWFRSNDDYETQSKRGFVECPLCGSNQVDKALMAPSVSTGRAKDERRHAVMVAAGQAMQREALEKLRQMTRAVKDNSTDVGAQFPDKARKMHYGEADPEPIYGTATSDEVESLIDEGVEVMPLPDLPEDMN